VTPAPRWLDHQWKGGKVPQSLLTGSLEERAARILEMVQNEQRELETI
jgi:hypothetical protein